MAAVRWSVGSQWVRWDPHLHAPGTLLNDQFNGDWDGYIKALKAAVPPVRALGITDYFCMAAYKAVLSRRSDLSPAAIPLIFPNIEIRLTIETKNRSAINLHLLVCPDDADHVPRVEEKLAQLRFTYRGEQIPCSEDGLIRLGRMHSGNKALAAQAAMSFGANQFKIDLAELRDLFAQDKWMSRNVLVAIAGGGDGLGGLSEDASFHAQREELGRFASCVFSGNPKDRIYWLGAHPDFQSTERTPKPCLHGCDAHSINKVLTPDDGRICWVRAKPSFEGLRQTLLEPARRVFIGEEPPKTASVGHVIRTVAIDNAPWFGNGTLQLNDSLTCIIGAKGSGKTALAELIALAAGAADVEPSSASFLGKAGTLLDGVQITLGWDDDTSQSITVGEWNVDNAEPRVRYLSQQFVERLCGPNRLAEPLVDEIERVVFNAIDDDERLQCSSFDELRSLILRDPIAERESEKATICSLTQQITDENSLSKSLATLKAKATEAARAKTAIEQELKTIPVKVSEARAKAHQACGERLKKLQEDIASEQRRERDIRSVLASVQRQLRGMETSIASLRNENEGLLEDEVWDLLKPRLVEGAEARLSALADDAKKRAELLRMHGVPILPSASTGTPGGDAPLGLALLTAEHQRLTKDLGLDELKVKRRSELMNRLTTAKQNEESAKKQLQHAEKSPERRVQARDKRLGCYEKVFATLIAEETALRDLYRPLSDRIKANPRLSKLSFSVERSVDLAGWVRRGESLLDLRKPPFQGRGELDKAVRQTLLEAWRTGSAPKAKEAMENFLNKYAQAIFESLSADATPKDCGEWLFATDHISIRYGIRYEGTEISQLSPGTKGIVLLMLYLGLDQWDKRPLVIDQPEENLDPRSVYSDLVPFFREAAIRRQIIMVTHNANLVVNTDADQVVVAQSHREAADTLPRMTYDAGGLEDPETRKEVCLLLEGGEDAFKKRELRYGIG